MPDIFKYHNFSFLVNICSEIFVKFFSLCKYIFTTSGKDLPINTYFGPRMTPTANKRGLLMTSGKEVYSFHCLSNENCFWTKKPCELKISRQDHVFLTVPSSLIENC